jgi:hypothetical protein
MTGPERDDDLDAYLRRALPLHRQLSELESIEPPEDLDRVVLRQARQAIRGSPGVPVFRAPRWALPAGLAATLLLVVAVCTSMFLRINAPHTVMAARQAAPVTDSMLAEVTVATPAAKSRPEADIPGTSSTRTVLAAVAPDPAAWLRRIERLRSEGKAPEADRELRKFRATFPYYPLRASRALPASAASTGASGAAAASQSVSQSVPQAVSKAASGASPPEDSRASAPRP